MRNFNLNWRDLQPRPCSHWTDFVAMTALMLAIVLAVAYSLLTA